jgi:hypothetical protein
MIYFYVLMIYGPLIFILILILVLLEVLLT